MTYYEQWLRAQSPAFREGFEAYHSDKPVLNAALKSPEWQRGWNEAAKKEATSERAQYL